MNIDQVMRVVATKGPVLPMQIVKELGGNSVLAGALLSQLIHQKRAFISHVKVGSSPVYYVAGQEPRLQDYAKYLNEKDRQTYELLKQQKILRDSEQTPLVRVSLRNIKDFAIPLEVSFGDEKEIFWKWYLLSDEDSTEIIRENLKINDRIIEENRQAMAKIKEVEGKKAGYTHIQDFDKKENKEEEQGKEEKDGEKETIKEEEKEDCAERPALQTLPKKQEIEEKAPESPVLDIKTNDPFLEKIITFLKSKEIIIKKFEIKKKNSEIDFNLIVPSAVGQVEYYCKAKNKKKVNDSDISSAYVQGQLKKLPAIILTTGDLTKKAKELLTKEIKISTLKI